METSHEEEPKAEIVGLFTTRINNSQKEVLLVKGKSGNWYFPGGKIEENEDEKDCLIREVMEELSINLQNHSIDELDIGKFKTPNGKLKNIKTFTVENLGKILHTTRKEDTVQDVIWTNTPLSLDLSEHAKYIILKHF